MTYGSSYADLAHPKGEPGHVARDKRRDLQRLIDERESAKVRRRSEGRCELPDCGKRATEVHHFLGGYGRRGVGESALAKNKAHLCQSCHRAVTDKVVRIWWHNIKDRFGTRQVER